MSESVDPEQVGEASALSDNTAYLLYRLGAEATRRLATELAPLGLRPRHFAAFHALSRTGGCSQRSLGIALAMDPNSVVAVVDELQRQGLVERRRDAQDRRRYALFLTDEGHGMLARIQDAAGRVEASMLVTVDPAQHETLRRQLLAMNAGTGTLRR